MKNWVLFACLVVLFGFGHAFADSGDVYFSRGEFEVAKPVQLVGAARSKENLAREDQVGKTLEMNAHLLADCHERAIAVGIPPMIESTFYFAVRSDGSFANVTADLRAADIQGTYQRSVEGLFNCATQQIQRLKAANWKESLVFRFNIRFEVRARDKI
jgi:hypothetical protein